MKKISIFFCLLSVLLIYAGSDVHASNHLTQEPSLTGETSNDILIRRASATQSIEIYIYMLENDSESYDLDETFSELGDSPVDIYHLSEGTLDFYSDYRPSNGSVSFGDSIDDWSITYSANEDFVGTDNFTLTVDGYDGDETFLLETTVLVGEADTPEDFRIAINYNAVGVPQVTDISWRDNSYIGNTYAYTLASAASLAEAEDSDFADTLSNRTETEFKSITFNQLVPDNEKRYYIAMKATRYVSTEYDDPIELPYDADGSNNTYLPSEYSNYLIVDGGDCPLPPHTPGGVTAKISGRLEAEVTFSGNENMLDFKQYEIRYWIDGSEAPTSHPAIISTSRSGSVKIPDLADKTTYNFQVMAVDYDNNESSPVQASLYMEKTFTTLENPDLFEGGCFVSDIQMPAAIAMNPMIVFLCMILPPGIVFIRRKSLSGILLLPLVFTLIMALPAYAREKNTTGIKIGMLKTLDDTQELSYDDTDIQLGLFYDRELFYHVSIEVEAGYIEKDGYEYTESGRTTGIETTLTLVPVSSTIKLNYEFNPLIFAYIGAGPDLWYYKEENDFKKIDAFDDDNYGVGGYHGKIGVYLKSADEYIKSEMGVVLECVYSKIDRFGDNEIDLGGVCFNFGIFLMF